MRNERMVQPFNKLSYSSNSSFVHTTARLMAAEATDSSVASRWKKHLASQKVTTVTGAWLLLAPKIDVGATTYRSWHKDPNAVKEASRRLIERAIMRHLLDGPGETNRDASAPPPPPSEPSVAPSDPPSPPPPPPPDAVMAQDFWVEPLRMVSRTSLVYDRMVLLYRDIMVERRRNNIKRSEGYVYVNNDAPNSRVKVGIAVNPHKRTSDLKTAAPDIRLDSYFWTEDTQGVETLVHRFARIAERQNPHNNPKNEWFSLTSTDAAVCVQIARFVVDDTYNAERRQSSAPMPAPVPVSTEPEERASVPPEETKETKVKLDG